MAPLGSFGGWPLWPATEWHCKACLCRPPFLLSWVAILVHVPVAVSNGEKRLFVRSLRLYEHLRERSEWVRHVLARGEVGDVREVINVGSL